MSGEYQLLDERKSSFDLESSSSHHLLKTDSASLQHEKKTRITAKIKIILPWVIHTILIVISTTLFILSTKNKHCLCDNAFTSVVGKEWSTHISPRRFNGTFKVSSAFKGPPNKAVDEAWDSIMPLNLMRIKESEFRSINASKYAAEIGDAEGGRIALFESFHMIHCLRRLWQNTYPEYYTELHAYNQEHLEEFHDHADHCADILRQKLMCDADGAMITYNWIKNHYYPHPNFNVEHQCRDYSTLLEFAEQRRLDGAPPLRPDGKTVVEFEEEPFDPDAAS